MTKTAHTRKFSLSDAQAGAPVTRRDGIAARFLAYVPDAERYEQVLYLAKAGGRSIHSTSAEGRAAHSVELGADLVMAPLGFIDGKPVFTGDEYEYDGKRFKAIANGEGGFDGCRWPHVHAEVIKAWADGSEIEWRATDSEGWRAIKSPAWEEGMQYRVKVEKQYPETTMTATELDRAWIGPQGLRKVANAALRHALDQGLVAFPGTAAPAPSQPAGAAKGRDGEASKRELAIAKAVHEAGINCLTKLGGWHPAGYLRHGLDLPAIIASVKETA